MSLTRFHISLTLEGILFTMSYLITLQTFSIGCKSRIFQRQSSNDTVSIPDFCLHLLLFVEVFRVCINSMCISQKSLMFRERTNFNEK